MTAATSGFAARLCCPRDAKEQSGAGWLLLSPWQGLSWCGGLFPSFLIGGIADFRSPANCFIPDSVRLEAMTGFPSIRFPESRFCRASAASGASSAKEKSRQVRRLLPMLQIHQLRR
jgi:hypothetical protein